MGRAGLAVGALLVATAAAAAQPAAPSAADRAAAKEAFARGTRHFNVAEYDEAIAEFKASYKLVPAPLLLYNIAQAYRQHGACAEAARFYRSYLREAPAAKDRARVEQRVVEMDACVAAKPPTDGATPTRPPPDGPPPGDGTPPADPAHAGGGAPTNPAAPVAPTAITVPPPSPPRPPPPSDRGRALRLGGLVTAGVGVGGLAAGVLWSLRARSLGDDIEAACATGCTAAAVLAADRDGAAAERNATIAYAAGAVAVAVAVGLYVVGRQRAHERPAIALVPTLNGGLAVAAWTWR